MIQEKNIAFFKNFLRSLKATYKYTKKELQKQKAVCVT